MTTTRGSTLALWILENCLKLKGTTTCRCRVKRSSKVEHLAKQSNRLFIELTVLCWMPRGSRLGSGKSTACNNLSWVNCSIYFEKIFASKLICIDYKPCPLTVKHLTWLNKVKLDAQQLPCIHTATSGYYSQCKYWLISWYVSMGNELCWNMDPAGVKLKHPAKCIDV